MIKNKPKIQESEKIPSQINNEEKKSTPMNIIIKLLENKSKEKQKSKHRDQKETY